MSLSALPILALFIVNHEPVEVSPIALESIAVPAINLEYEKVAVDLQVPAVPVFTQSEPDSWQEVSRRIKSHSSGEIVFKSSKIPDTTFVLRRQQLASGAQWELISSPDSDNEQASVWKKQWGMTTVSSAKLSVSDIANVNRIFGVSRAWGDIWNTLVPTFPANRPRMSEKPVHFDSDNYVGYSVYYSGWDWNESVGVDLPNKIVYRNLMKSYEKDTEITVLVSDFKMPSEVYEGWPITPPQK